ncbi:MAG TPA: hypothetical protein VJR06_08335, partial [Nitrososphaerales archaeon]|nr:hypothetical protein [Nitrososphaerales archaeon]
AAEMTLAHHLGRETLEVLEYQTMAIGFSTRAQELRISAIGLDSEPGAIVPLGKLQIMVRK